MDGARQVRWTSANVEHINLHIPPFSLSLFASLNELIAAWLLPLRSWQFHDCGMLSKIVFHFGCAVHVAYGQYFPLSSDIFWSSGSKGSRGSCISQRKIVPL